MTLDASITMNTRAPCGLCGGQLQPDPADDDQLVCSLCKGIQESEDIPDNERLMGPEPWGLIQLALDHGDPTLRSTIEVCWRRCEEFTPLKKFKNQLEREGIWQSPVLELYAPSSAHLRLKRHLVENSHAVHRMTFSMLANDSVPFPIAPPADV